MNQVSANANTIRSYRRSSTPSCTIKYCTCQIVFNKNLLRMNPLYPRYPAYIPHSESSIRFSVPDERVIKRLLAHCEDEENMRLKAAGNVLYPHVKTLSRLLSRYKIEVERATTNELGITLFLPRPPCPEPKQKTIARLRHKLLKNVRWGDQSVTRQCATKPTQSQSPKWVILS